MPEDSTGPKSAADPQFAANELTPSTQAMSDGTIVQVGPPTALQPSRAAGRQVAGFDILGELGRGGMGVVYQAKQHGLGRVVALKMVLHGSHATEVDLQRFRDEAGAIARLQHPNIVEVYAYGEADGLPYFALEFCSGGTLANRCAAGPLPVREAAELGVVLAYAVQAAHAAGIVHRDLKPANVLLSADGTPKITDFGLAKGMGDTEERTRTGAVLGTPNYMAPEQASGQTRNVGPAADVYALGAILYCLLTGRPPFDGNGVMETLHRVQKDEPTPPRRLRRDVPADLEAVVLRCLEKLPSARYPSAAELAADLERWLRGEPVRAHRHSVVYRLRKRAARNRRWIAAGAAIALAVLGLWLGMADKGNAVLGGDGMRRWLDRHELSVFRPAPREDAIRAAAVRQRGELADHALHTASRKGGWISGNMKAGVPFDRPDAWGQLQSVACLLSAPEATNDDLRPLVVVLHTELFGSNPVCPPFDPKQGWAHFYDGQPATEGCGWSLVAISAALSRPGLCTTAERELLLARLAQVQATLDLCHVRDPRTGGDTGRWNMVTQPRDGADGNIFTTTLVFQGLIELSRAGLPWRGDAARRDALLRATHAAIVEQFNGKGWVTRGRSLADLNDGLTLQLFALLLRAESYGLAELPPAVAERIPRHLADCRARRFDHPINTAVFDTRMVGRDGKEIDIQRPVRFLWHPWAVECAARWLDRLKQKGAPHDEVVATRRILGHLVLTLGAQATDELKNDYTYVLMETVLALRALETRE